MVAYSFQKRFAPPIAEYRKLHTIRGERKRHARPGERVQLYQGMRTRYCRKIIPDPVCNIVLPILITFRSGLIERVLIDGNPVENMQAFAVSDGFADPDDMSTFWGKTHGAGEDFHGFLISWKAPQVSGAADE